MRVAGTITAYVENIILHCYKNLATKRCEPLSPSWTPPPVDQVCVDVDAEIFQNDHRMGWGAVVRDHTGSCVLACNGGAHGILSPELAEAMAVRQVLSFMGDRGFQKIILLSVCLSLIQL